MYESFALYVSICTMYMPNTSRGQKRKSDLELELQTAINHHMGAGN